MEERNECNNPPGVILVSKKAGNLPLHNSNRIQAEAEVI